MGGAPDDRGRPRSSSELVRGERLPNTPSSSTASGLRAAGAVIYSEVCPCRLLLESLRALLPRLLCPSPFSGQSCSG